MPDISFNTTANETIEREKLVCYMNMGTITPGTGDPYIDWQPLGKRVTDSSESYDWSDETAIDILGAQRTILHTPLMQQTFDPVKLDSADSPAVKVWNTAIKERRARGLTHYDLLIVHLYAEHSTGYAFAEEYDACAVYPTGIGGAGGGDVEMPIEVRFGGTRTTGKAAIADGILTFTADT